MASLKTNFVLPIVVLLFLGAVGTVVFKVLSKPQPFVAEANATQPAASIYTADADGTSETIRALQAAVEAQREEQKSLMAQNTALMEQNKNVLNQLASRDSRTQSVVDQAVKKSQSENAAENSEMTNQLITLQNSVRDLMDKASSSAPVKKIGDAVNSTEIVPGFGLGNMGSDYDASIDSYWVGEGSGGGGGETGFTSLAMQDSGALGGIRSAASSVYTGKAQGKEITSSAPVEPNELKPVNAKRKEAKTPELTAEAFYTIPDLSALTGGVAATSLIGRVYDDDKISDPYPFKVSVGRENFAASFVDLPDEIEGMLFEGYAVGDWTLSCVRGDLVAASFVFDDGTVVKAYGTDKGSRPEEAQIKKNTIGYIADEYGNPCIGGTKHTSAPPALLSRFMATALEGYGAAVADAETERFTDSNGSVTTAVTGDISRFAGGQALSSGASDAADWIRRRAGRLIDVVYAESGATISVHLQQEIYIDKVPDARKVRYAKQGKRHADLD